MRFLKKTSKDLPTASPGGEKSFALFKNAASRAAAAVAGDAQAAPPRRTAPVLDPEVVDVEARAVDPTEDSVSSDATPAATPVESAPFEAPRAFDARSGQDPGGTSSDEPLASQAASKSKPEKGVSAFGFNVFRKSSPKGATSEEPRPEPEPSAAHQEPVAVPEPSVRDARPEPSAAKPVFPGVPKRGRPSPHPVLLVKDASGAASVWSLDPAGAEPAPDGARPAAVLADGDTAVAGSADASAHAAAKALLSAAVSQPVRCEAWQVRGKRAVLAVSVVPWPKDSKSAAAAAAQAIAERALVPRPQDLVVVDLGSPVKPGPRLVFETLDSGALVFRAARSGEDPEDAAGRAVHELDSAAFLAALANAAAYKASGAAKGASLRLAHLAGLAVPLALAAAAYGGYEAWKQHEALLALRQQLVTSESALSQVKDELRAEQARASSRQQLQQLLSEPWGTPLTALARLWMPSAEMDYALTRDSAHYTLKLPLPQPHLADQVPEAELRARLLSQAAPATCSSTLQPVEKTSREVVIFVACSSGTGSAGGL